LHSTRELEKFATIGALKDLNKPLSWKDVKKCRDLELKYGSMRALERNIKKMNRMVADINSDAINVADISSHKKIEHI